MDLSQPTASDRRLYTAAQVRELDRAAIEDHNIPGSELMERAGLAAFDHICEQFPDCGHWLVICGGGNNGGDGYVIARLAREAGINCRLCALKPPEALQGDAARSAHRWLNEGGAVEIGPPRDVGDFDLIVDAMLGTGLDRAPEGEYADAIRSVNESVHGSVNGSGAAVVAIDIPSGLNADTGCAMGGCAVVADVTITFIGRKRGLYTADGPDYSGRVHYARLDIPYTVFSTIENTGKLLHEKDIKNDLRPRLRNSHKGHFGWLIGVGGDRGMSGALRLCGEAALRSGAGKVTLVTHPEHAAFLNVMRPELMVRGIEDPSALADQLEQADAVVLGPGLGQSGWSESFLSACLGFERPMVVDADALNLMAAKDALDTLAADSLRAVITPHPAEAGRLLGVSAAAVQSDRVSAALQLAERSASVVVLKGCGTVISAPDGRYAICPLGNPGMASGGTGDVLAGVIGALLAQGFGAWEAATTGVLAHAAAGDRAAAEIGERGLIASDISDRLPAVLNPA